jgi:chromosome segregation ATPase
MYQAPDASRMYQELQNRSLASSDRERALDQKRAALAALRTQVNSAADAVQNGKKMLRADQQEFAEKKRSVDEKVQSKQNHNNAQQERLAHVLQQEELLQQQIASTNAAIEASRQAIDKKQRESNVLAEAEERLTKVKLQIEEDGNTLFQLGQRVERHEAAIMKRHNLLTESLPAFPLAQVSNSGSASGLESTATESIILIDDSRV